MCFWCIFSDLPLLCYIFCDGQVSPHTFHCASCQELHSFGSDCTHTSCRAGWGNYTPQIVLLAMVLPHLFGCACYGSHTLAAVLPHLQLLYSRDCTHTGTQGPKSLSHQDYAQYMQVALGIKLKASYLQSRHFATKLLCRQLWFIFHLPLRLCQHHICTVLYFSGF